MKMLSICIFPVAFSLCSHGCHHSGNCSSASEGKVEVVAYTGSGIELYDLNPTTRQKIMWIQVGTLRHKIWGSLSERMIQLPHLFHRQRQASRWGQRLFSRKKGYHHTYPPFQDWYLTTVPSSRRYSFRVAI